MNITLIRNVAAPLLVAVACALAPCSAGAQTAVPSALGAPTLQGAAFGQVAALTWTPVPGAAGYVVGVGITPDHYVLVQDVGNVLAVSVPAPAGVYFIRVAARDGQGFGAPSNEVTVVVRPPIGAPPQAPTALTAHVTGSQVQLSWALGAGGGSTTGVVLAVGSSPGAQNLGFLPFSVRTSVGAPVPGGTYFARLYAVGPGGVSAPSNEVVIAVGGGACAQPAGPVPSASVNGSAVVLSWTASPGVAGYRLDVAASAGGRPLLSQAFPASTTGLAIPSVPPGDYYVRVTAIAPCGAQTTGPDVLVHTGATARRRTPDPPPGQRLPLPNRLSVLQEVAAQYPNDLRNSCRDNGGDNTFLFRVVERLRREDSRWGLNWKRARRGDMSQDVINYHWGAGPDEDSTATYVVDIIAGHCGGNPNVWWKDVTGEGGAGARWTLQPYIQAGFQP